MKEMVGGCCVCSDERGWAENPLVYCDGQGCTVAVHQACYGIVTVPTGPWFCRKCESQERAVRVRCELCPIKDGALKRTDNQAWAHVVCALYIPEVRFGNVSTMEPIILSLVPSERYNKTCYICDTQGKGSRAVQGACMNCNKPGCKMQFHVTCAQGLGLLCEEAGNYMDNVKYCGYCQHHYSKLKKGGNVKQVPPYKPVPNDSPEEREEGGRKRKSQGGKGGGRGRNATPSPNLNKQGAASPSPGSESGDHSRASTPAGSNGTATKELLPPPSSSSSVIKDSKDKDKKEEKGKESEKDKDKDKKDSKDVANSNISSTASTTSAKFTTSNFVETVVTPSESVFGADGSKAATGSSGSSNTKKRRNAGGVRTPPSSTPSQDKDTKEKEKDALGSSSAPAAPSPTSAPSNTSASVTKMDIDETCHSGSPDAVEKGVKKLKIVAEPNLNTLGSNQSNSESSTKGPQNSVSSPGPMGPSVSSSANSIVVSVPLTAAVSLPNTASQQVSSAINQAMSNSSSTPIVPSAIPADPHPSQISSSSGNSSNKLPASENLGKRSRSFSGEKPERVEKQDKRKLKRGGQHQVGASSSVPSNPTPSPSPATPTTPSPPTSSVTPPVSTPLPSPSPLPLLSAPILSTSSFSMNPSPISVSPSITPAPILSPVSSTSLSHSPMLGRRGRPSSTSNPPPTPPVPTQTPPTITSSPLDTKPGPDDLSSSAISMKESPPSSPEPVPHRGRPKGRRGHNTVQSSKEEKEQKIFQNGVTSINNAPHMLGHQLNPSSSMAQKMSDTLTAELEAHSVFSSEPNLSNQNNLVGPQLPTKVLANARAAETRSTPSSGVIPQTLDQLLERQWEQGSQFLMEQAQHFDIASLLTCLHQLRSENTRLEEHIRKLLARRDHLLAVNARLAIPLTQSQPPTPPHGTPGLPDGIGAGPSPGPLTPQGGSQGPTGPPSQSVGSVGAPHVAQGSPQLPSQGAASVSTGHHVHQSSHSQNHTQSHSQSHSQGHPQHLQHSQGHPQSLSHLHQQGHSQGHPQGHPSGHPQGHPSSHSQGHPPSHSQGHPQGLSQGHPQGHPQGLTSGHSQGHPSGHPQGHPQSHSQGHPQGHPQTLLQNPPSQSSRQTSQRSSYGQPSLENGLPSESSSMLQGYGAHQRPQPSPNIRHTQSGSPYMMSQTPPTSNPSVVRSSPVSSEQGRRGVGVTVPMQGYPMYPQGSAIMMPVPPQQVVMHREADLHHPTPSKHS
ncbi:protein AF-17 isoform X2 [Frankliniella occidentalis]|uniref:Protein AF-17 isoform X2 n=1 Tax=Frankliniella occidentalis TaxID=133901 RepID=A0A6J1RUJ4_FRAOC|nr:protein AF-17 isoform X2 [Frankliniella occidentalis]